MFGIDGDNQPERPGIEELYESATNASSLKHYADRRTAADVLRDMAMSAEGIGAALRRLRGQWEATEKPVRQRNRSIKDFLATGLSREDAEEAHREERERHEAWYRRDMERLLGTLSELPRVRDALAVQALKWKIEQPEQIAAAVLRYWLDQTCPACHGQKFQKIAGTPTLSNKVCPPPRSGGCGGSGVAPVPHGENGKRLANHLDQCLHRYKQHMGARRKALQSIPPIDRLSKRMQPGGPDAEAD